MDPFESLKTILRFSKTFSSVFKKNTCRAFITIILLFSFYFPLMLQPQYNVGITQINIVYQK